jgi:hypothetical protein
VYKYNVAFLCQGRAKYCQYSKSPWFSPKLMIGLFFNWKQLLQNVHCSFQVRIARFCNYWCFLLLGLPVVTILGVQVQFFHRVFQPPNWNKLCIVYFSTLFQYSFMFLYCTKKYWYFCTFFWKLCNLWCRADPAPLKIIVKHFLRCWVFWGLRIFIRKSDFIDWREPHH